MESKTTFKNRTEYEVTCKFEIREEDMTRIDEWASIRELQFSNQAEKIWRYMVDNDHYMMKTSIRSVEVETAHRQIRLGVGE